MQLNLKQLQFGAYFVSLSVSILAVIAWGGYYGWTLNLSLYQIFPLFGLLAFSIMWSHYIAGFSRRLLGYGSEALADFYARTAAVVLGLILLHPGLLILQLFLD